MRLRGIASVAGALLLAACGTPTEPGRPPFYSVVFIGVPAGAEAFLPTAVDAGRVHGIATAGGASWPVVWTEQGGFARVLDPPAGCRAAPIAARAGTVVGEVVCAAGDVYGWGSGPAAPAARPVQEPHDLSAVSGAVLMGTIFPRAHLPNGDPRAFLATGGGVETLLPPGSTASVAGGLADDGTLAVTALSECDATGCATSRVAVRSAGAWTTLPLPIGTDRAVAVAVSSRGDVLGFAGGPAEQAFVYRRGETRPLPLVPGIDVVVSGVNALGQVVGTGTRPATAGRRRSDGLVWGRSRQYFLTERLLSPEWEILSATAIDDDRNIVGTGVQPATGLEGPVLLVPGGR